MMDILSPSFTSGHKYMGKSNVTTATTPAEGIAPPSPRLSMDENTLAMLMDDKMQQQETKRSSVMVLDKHLEEEPKEYTLQVNNDNDDDDQVALKKLVIDTTSVNLVNGSIYKNFPYQSPTAVAFTHDPSGYLVNKTRSLIYWEYPSQSAGFLCFILGGTWLTRYYSLLYLVSGLFTVVTSLNWVYVNANFHSYRILSGKPANTIRHPHGDRLLTQKRRAWFTESQVDHACEVGLNLVEGMVKQLIDLVLIKDNARSGYAVVISFMVWTLASMLSIKTMVMILTVVSFVVPRLYLEHQEKVDAWLLEQQQKVQGWLQRQHAQCQQWLQQYHNNVGQYVTKGLKMSYDALAQLALFIYQKQQQWVKQRQYAAALQAQVNAAAVNTATGDDDDEEDQHEQSVDSGGVDDNGKLEVDDDPN